MSNGYLCIGGPADGQYHSIPEGASHGSIVNIVPVVCAPIGWGDFVGDMTPMNVATYKVWQWYQGEWKGINVGARWYLIPVDWDGFEAMDHLEKRAYLEGRDEAPRASRAREGGR